MSQKRDASHTSSGRGGLTFRSPQKVKSRQDFKNVFNDSLRLRTKNFTVLGRPTKNLKPRLGVVVAKRNIKSAVLRNRAKRLIRESFRQNQYSLARLDVVVILRQPFSKKDALNEIKFCLDKLWPKINREWEIKTD